MADMSQAPLNGNYAAQHPYIDSFNPTHATMNTAANFQPAQSSTPTNATPTDHKSDIPKDEVGWFFVEQYYTTMSRNPDKLHLFYSRRSQLVFGTEAESVPVAIGTKAINDKIKQLDFQECKVRVLNVDSQASFDNILVTVIGEISNKSEPSRKFIQTFVLAQQPNGYYVLNDIFRYLVEEEDEIVEEVEAAAPVAEAPKVAEPAPAVDAQVTDDAAADKVDEKLEQEVNGEAEIPVEAPKTNGTAPEEEQTPAPAAVPDVAEEEPLAPEPTPAPVPEKEAPVKKEPAPAVPAGPKSWATIASKVGAPAAPAAAVAAAAPAATPVAPKTAAPAASAPQATPAASAAPAAEARSQEAAPSDGSGWQTAGSDHKKTQSRAGEQQNTLGYIKNVTDKIDASVLKQTLARFGKLNYFDVSRQKNCAFVEFAEPSGYAAAVAANPHQVGSEQILLEERRPRGNAYGSNGAGRGPAGRGRGDRAGSQGRGGFQREGRGGFAPRGRGGNVASNKGRSQAQAA